MAVRRDLIITRVYWFIDSIGRRNEGQDGARAEAIRNVIKTISLAEVSGLGGREIH